MTPRAGLVLGGRYELTSRIAVGGMGEVWRARDTLAGQEVAVKVMRAELAGDARLLQRLRFEARNSSRLHHPNLVAVLDHGEQHGSGYLVMELVDGEPLSDVVRRAGGTLDAGTLLPILLQVARGLQAVHAAGVVHRDLKPGNVLVTATGTAKLTDFGISLAGDQAPMTAAGRVMGTAQYLAPEQVTGQPARPAGDLYALGVVAYEALAGRRPFSGATDVDVAVAHVHDPVPELPATVPGPVRAVVTRLLAKEPAQRPADAGELARTLAEVIGQLHDGDTRPGRVRGATRLALTLGVLGLGSLTLADSVALGEAADAPPTPTTTKDG